MDDQLRSQFNLGGNKMGARLEHAVGNSTFGTKRTHPFLRLEHKVVSRISGHSIQLGKVPVPHQCQADARKKKLVQRLDRFRGFDNQPNKQILVGPAHYVCRAGDLLIIDARSADQGDAASTPWMIERQVDEMLDLGRMSHMRNQQGLTSPSSKRVIQA